MGFEFNCPHCDMELSVNETSKYCESECPECSGSFIPAEEIVKKKGHIYTKRGFEILAGIAKDCLDKKNLLWKKLAEKHGYSVPAIRKLVQREFPDSFELVESWDYPDSIEVEFLPKGKVSKALEAWGYDPSSVRRKRVPKEICVRGKWLAHLDLTRGDYIRLFEKEDCLEIKKVSMEELDTASRKITVSNGNIDPKELSAITKDYADWEGPLKKFAQRYGIPAKRMVRMLKRQWPQYYEKWEPIKVKETNYGIPTDINRIKHEYETYYDKESKLETIEDVRFEMFCIPEVDIPGKYLKVLNLKPGNSVRIIKRDKSLELIRIEKMQQLPENFFKNEPNGFLGIKWGTDISVMDDMKSMNWSCEACPCSHETIYTKQNDSLEISESEIGTISYVFYQDKFSAVRLSITGLNNFNAIRDAISQQFGGSKLSELSEHLGWQGDSSLITQRFCRLLEEGFFLIASIQMLKQREEDNIKMSLLEEERGPISHVPADLKQKSTQELEEELFDFLIRTGYAFSQPSRFRTASEEFWKKKGFLARGLETEEWRKVSLKKETVTRNVCEKLQPITEDRIKAFLQKSSESIAQQMVDYIKEDTYLLAPRSSTYELRVKFYIKHGYPVADYAYWNGRDFLPVLFEKMRVKQDEIKSLLEKKLQPLYEEKAELLAKEFISWLEIKGLEKSTRKELREFLKGKIPNVSRYFPALIFRKYKRLIK